MTTYPITLTLPGNTRACVQQNWRRIVTQHGEVRIESTYNEQFTLACALLTGMTEVGEPRTLEAIKERAAERARRVMEVMGNV